MQITPELIWTAVAIAGVLVVALLIAAGVRRSRTAHLRELYGTEYERTVQAKGNRKRAERELIQREQEVKTFDIRSLTAAERDRFRQEWLRVEARFVERPTTAVVEADELVADIMRTCGYPMGDFEKHAAHLSVKHPKVVDHYRSGHRMIEKNVGASTEDLRQAMLHYRTLIEELLGGTTDVAREVPTAYEVGQERPELVRPDAARDEKRA